MQQRYTFQCYRDTCNRTYTLLRETITHKQTVQIACPYCGQEAVVDFAPIPKRIKEAMRSPQAGTDIDEELDLPAILPTRKPD